ncbi:MAG TPA: hypothetical protein VGL77_19475 [Armatimonadota bacterium]
MALTRRHRIAGKRENRRHDHCEQCQEFPYAMLNEYAYDPQHGDQGTRSHRRHAWNTETTPGA